MVEAASSVSENFEDLPTLTREEIREHGLPSGGCIVRKMIPDKKSGKSYGPYFYHVRKVNGKQTWTYLGKTWSDMKHNGLVRRFVEEEA